MKESSLQYRPYLDGLRAVAVVMVFVFHATRVGLPGGFIGVDIFFVLSGYLITRILIAQHSAIGGISITSFYARRIRRLMPAVIVLVLVVVAREAVWGDVLELGSRLKDSLATLFYVENWNLISQADQYFEEGTSVSPLRHAWSLSIEEQFYVLWPLALIPILAIGRAHRRLSALLVLGLVLLSALAMAMLYEPDLVVRSYYGTDSRVHQPLIGALLAFVISGREPGRTQVRRPLMWPLIGGVSLVALILAAVTLSGDSPAYYRGGSLLIASLTATLILSLEQSPTGWISRSLGWDPIRQLGRISYGFYLWHWPVILWVAVPVGVGFWERRVVNLGQFALTLAISVASFRLVENPIRERRGWLGKLKPMGAIGIGIGTLIAAGAVSYAVLSPDEGNLATVAVADRSFEACPNDPQPCVKVEGATVDAPTVVLIGDSTAQSYDPALKELAGLYGFRYVQAAVGGCPIGHRLLATGENGDLHKPSNFLCYEEIPDVYRTVVEEYEPDLIIGTSWNEKNQHVEDDVLLLAGTPEHILSTEAALRDALTYLTSDGANVALLDILPPGMSVECLEIGGSGSDACVRPVTPRSGEAPYNQIFHRIAAEDNAVMTLSLLDVVCPRNSCPLMLNGSVLRYDGNHFTGTGSRDLALVIDRKLREAGIDLSTLAEHATS